jgi:hypothetical protein
MTDRPVQPGELTYARVFAAPRELVFQAMIDPAQLAQFWGPRPASAHRWRPSRSILDRFAAYLAIRARDSQEAAGHDRRDER